MIYLASPYSHPDPVVRNQRFEEVCRLAATLMAQGKHVFSPIAHTLPIALHGNLPTGWDYWESLDRFWIGVCDEVIAMMLDGWRESVGVRAEIAIARELGKPVTYFTPRKNETLFGLRSEKVV